jgi:hypothetical protein
MHFEIVVVAELVPKGTSFGRSAENKPTKVGNYISISMVCDYKMPTKVGNYNIYISRPMVCDYIKKRGPDKSGDYKEQKKTGGGLDEKVFRFGFGSSYSLFSIFYSLSLRRGGEKRYCHRGEFSGARSEVFFER